MKARILHSRFATTFAGAANRWRWHTLAVLAALWLAGAAACSMVSLGYANAPSLLAYRAGDWFALDGEQAAALRTKLDDFYAWHRQTELPRLVRGLDEARTRLDRPLLMADADWLVAEAQQRYRATIARMIDQAAPLLPTLRGEQIDRLERELAKRNREFARKYIDAPADKVREARLARVEDNVSDWIGEMTPEQRRWLAARVEALPVDYRTVLADNQRRQRELVAILKQAAASEAKTDVAAADSRAAALGRWATDWESGRPAAYRAQVEAWRQGYQRIAVELLNSATPAQKARVRERLQGYAADLASFVQPAQARGG